MHSYDALAAAAQDRPLTQAEADALTRALAEGKLDVTEGSLTDAMRKQRDDLVLVAEPALGPEDVFIHCMRCNAGFFWAADADHSPAAINEVLNEHTEECV